MRRTVMITWARSFVGLSLGAALVGCEPGDPCADYVDYMCACHATDTGVDCDTLGTTYEDASAAVQDECAVLLDEQESADQADGLVCEI